MHRVARLVSTAIAAAAVAAATQGLTAQNPVGTGNVGGTGQTPAGIEASNLGAAAADMQAVRAYWTPERMASAIEKEHVVTGPVGTAAQSSSEGQLAPDATPGYARGFLPNRSISGAATVSLDAQPMTSPPFSPPGFPTDYGNYAPFQRWTHFGNYFTYPISTIGKLFFTQYGLNYVCSASVIGNRALATAGHCVHAGDGSAGGWSYNFFFCPSYNPGGCVRGGWAWSFASTSGTWYNGGTDRDYACIVTSPTGTMFANPVGSITGATGRAWNFPTRQLEMAYGYPQAAPFPGHHIIVSASTEWYEVNMTPTDGLVSKYIGSDQTGGSSGGPWWLSLRHPNGSFEYADTDGSGSTDPFQGSGGPYINGVNSHKRCSQGGCPAGSIYTQEMGSPQFRNTAGDGDETEDVFANCYANGG